MSALLWEFIAIAWAPLGAYGALVEGSMRQASRDARTETTLVA
jgi:hypothetical protein